MPAPGSEAIKPRLLRQKREDIRGERYSRGLVAGPGFVAVAGAGATVIGVVVVATAAGQQAAAWAS